MIDQVAMPVLGMFATSAFVVCSPIGRLTWQFALSEDGLLR